MYRVKGRDDSLKQSITLAGADDGRNHRHTTHRKPRYRGAPEYDGAGVSHPASALIALCIEPLWVTVYR